MLHSQTTLLLAALFFVVLPALVWWTTVGERGASVAWWCAGGLVAALGIVLMGLRPRLPDWASYNAANGSLLASLVFWAQSLRVLQRKGWSAPQVLLWVALGVLYYSLLKGFVEPNHRGMGMRAALGGLAFYIAWQAASVARRLRSHNAAALAVAYLALGLGLWAQLLLHGGGGPQPSPFSNTWDASVIALIVLATAAAGHFCYTGLVLDRSTSRQVETMEARTATQEMAKLETQLRELDREGRLVLVSGSLAHELNQPLTAALAHAQVAHRALGMGRTDQAGLADLLGKVAASLRRASNILERIRTPGQTQVPRTPLDLREVAQDAIELFRPEWRKLGLQIDLWRSEQPLWCQGDEVALCQVVVNLLSNATHAVEQGPRRQLQVQCLRAEGEVRVVVRDYGCGVPPQVLAQWGEPFTGTREQGLGLGLAISRAIAQQHQGRLTLRNHPEGGAEAMLALPLDEEPGR